MNLFSAAFDKLAGASGATWLAALPWALALWGASLGVASAWGWHEGSVRTESKWEARKAEAEGAAAQIFANQIKQAASTSLAIITKSQEFVSQLKISTMQQKVIVEKVSSDAHADSKLVACIVPDSVRELRRRQVEESTSISAQDRPM